MNVYLHVPPDGQNIVFHQAIPTHDLELAVEFYQGKLGCKLSRRYDDRVTFDFFTHQLVCHLCPDKVDQEVAMYPRHFGLTFVDTEDFDLLYSTAKTTGCSFFKDLFVRFDSLPERHRTFFLIDPSNNLI